MFKMTTRYLMKAPLISLLLTHQEHSPSFLRAVLSILHDNPVADGKHVLIHGEDSNDWDVLSYDNPNDQPPDKQKWYDIVAPQVDEVVPFWMQFGLNRECAKANLKCLKYVEDCNAPHKSPLLTFKELYPVLFEGLQAVFGLMMSNSRLCEQIHGMLRFGLSSSIGMDQADAQQHMLPGQIT